MFARKVIVSLFDESGNAVREFAKAGAICWCFDLQNLGQSERFDGGGVIHYVSADLFSPQWIGFILGLKPDLLFAFPPCTDLANSGSRHWKAKAEKNPNFWQDAMRLVYLARDIAETIGCPYAIENPVGKVSTLWRKPDYKFQPYEYGGYLPADDKHPRFPDLIAPRDAYPKMTCLWTGNGFVMPEKKPVPVPVGYSTQYKKLGGKSARTKKIRSETPRGFFIALFEQLTKQEHMKIAA